MRKNHNFQRGPEIQNIVDTIARRSCLEMDHEKVSSSALENSSTINIGKRNGAYLPKGRYVPCAILEICSLV